MTTVPSLEEVAKTFGLPDMSAPPPPAATADPSSSSEWSGLSSDPFNKRSHKVKSAPSTETKKGKTSKGKKKQKDGNETEEDEPKKKATKKRRKKKPESDAEEEDDDGEEEEEEEAGADEEKKRKSSKRKKKVEIVVKYEPPLTQYLVYQDENEDWFRCEYRRAGRAVQLADDPTQTESMQELQTTKDPRVFEPIATNLHQVPGIGFGGEKSSGGKRLTLKKQKVSQPMESKAFQQYLAMNSEQMKRAQMDRQQRDEYAFQSAKVGLGAESEGQQRLLRLAMCGKQRSATLASYDSGTASSSSSSSGKKSAAAAAAPKKTGKMTGADFSALRENNSLAKTSYWNAQQQKRV